MGAKKTMDIYHDRNRQLQERFGTQKLAGALGSPTDMIDDERRSFIEACNMFFMATVDDAGHLNCSYKGGAPGVVRVVDEHTLAFPSYDGNGMFLSMGNVLQTGEVGMLFIDFEAQRRVRVNGQVGGLGPRPGSRWRPGPR